MSEPHEFEENISPLVLIDGDCVLCSRVAHFILAREKEPFHFGTLSSNLGQSLLTRYSFPPGTDSMVAIVNGKASIESDAAIEIARRLRFPWSLGAALRFVPKSLRNRGYRFVASHRYKWFGKEESVCSLNPELVARMVDGEPPSP